MPFVLLSLYFVAECIVLRFDADPMVSRIEPSQNPTYDYAITAQRLSEIRKLLMYPYYDMDPQGGNGDLQENINAQNSQVNKQLTFLLPYFGFGLNYTWVSFIFVIKKLIACGLLWSQ